MDATKITISTTINAPLSTVWRFWNSPEHITQWYFASPEWHCPKAVNDLQPGGRFSFRMEARDGSMGFDFAGFYKKIVLHERIIFTLDDDRKVEIDFLQTEDCIRVVQTFEAEPTNPVDMQRAGWQAILDNFKMYAESQSV
jgi:uncharacterized protein YndB with AHSA1/START domain